MYQSRGRGAGERGDSEFEEKVVQVNRVSKKTQGGNQMAFSVLVVVGDKKGKVGVGLGKAKDVLSGIRKGARRARAHMIRVAMRGSTIPFPMTLKWGAARVVLRPAPEGTGIIAGGAVRAVLDAAGVRDVVSKILGTNSKATNVYATFEALKRMNELAEKKGSDLSGRSDPSPIDKPTNTQKNSQMRKDTKVQTDKKTDESNNRFRPKADPPLAETH